MTEAVTTTHSVHSTARHTRSLRANFSWMFVGMMTYAVCQWGCLIVMAKYGSQVMVGQFALGLAVTAPVFMLCNLKLRNIQATDAAGQFRFVEYFSLRVVTSTAALLFVLALAWSAGYGQRVAWLITIVGLGRGFDSINDIHYGLLQRHEQMQRVAAALIVNGVASLALLAVGTILLGDVLYGVLGWTLGFGLTCGLTRLWVGPAVLATEKTAEARDLRQPLWRLTITALPLGVVMMLVSLSTNIPSYVVESRLGTEALGVFAAIAYLIEAGRRMILALGQSASPRLARYFSAGEVSAFGKLLLRLVLIGAAAGLAGASLSWLIGSEILSLLYTGEYSQYSLMLVQLSLVAILIFASSFLGDGMIAARCLRSQVPLLIAVVLATATAAYILIPSWRLTGAVAAIAIGSLVHTTGSAGIIVWAMSRRSIAAKETS